MEALALRLSHLDTGAEGAIRVVMVYDLDGEEIGAVWLERPGAPSPLDAVLLERLAIAAAAVVERYGPARTTMADPALVELVISAGSDQAASARALRLLGFAADLPVRVAAVHAQLPLSRGAPATGRRNA